MGARDVSDTLEVLFPVIHTDTLRAVRYNHVNFAPEETEAESSN